MEPLRTMDIGKMEITLFFVAVKKMPPRKKSNKKSRKSRRRSKRKSRKRSRRKSRISKRKSRKKSKKRSRKRSRRKKSRRSKRKSGKKSKKRSKKKSRKKSGNARQIRLVNHNDTYFSGPELSNFVKKLASKRSKNMIKIIDPCAGRKQLTPFGAIAADIRPLMPGIKKVNFLKSKLSDFSVRQKGKIMFVMNPPLKLVKVKMAGNYL